MDSFSRSASVGGSVYFNTPDELEHESGRLDRDLFPVVWNTSHSHSDVFDSFMGDQEDANNHHFTFSSELPDFGIAVPKIKEEELGEEDDGKESNQHFNVIESIQQQLYQHHLLYLIQIQQTLLSPHSSGLHSLSLPPPHLLSPSPLALQDRKSEKKKKLGQAFKVDHYKIRLTPHSPTKKKSKKLKYCYPISIADDHSFSSMSSLSDIPSSPDSSPESSADDSPPSSPTGSQPISQSTALIPLPLPSSSAQSPPQSPAAFSLAGLLPPTCVEEATRTASATGATILELSRRPELLTLKQSETARILGISTSVLSKRWREATKGKKWPHRVHHKLRKAEGAP